MVEMKDIVALCKRRGFIFQASEIYGGLNGFWDYGHLGVELKNNMRDIWWNDNVKCPPLDENGEPLKILGLDSSIIQNPTVWKASGHTENFSDPMVDDKITKSRYRADHIIVFVPKDNNGLSFAFLEGEDDVVINKKIKKLGGGKNPADYDVANLVDLPLDMYASIVAPAVDVAGSFTEPKAFNLMFETRIGALATSDSMAYLRPETAQGIFVDYKNTLDAYRPKMPFGIAQIGKSFRNEVTPRNFIFRSREFEQMELEWFCPAEDAEKWRDFWLDNRTRWWTSIGVDMNKIQIRPHDKDELSHYAKEGYGTSDIEFKFPFSGDGFSELEGIAHRCNFDLTQHQKFSGISQEYFDQITNQRFIPHVIEPASGLTRALLAVLCSAYKIDENRPSGMFLDFHPAVAPVKAAILPLQAKGEENDLARNLSLKLRQKHTVTFENKQSIGKRYARNDEIGTPFCITIDKDSVTSLDATVRDRNTMQLQRISLDLLPQFIEEAQNREF